MSLSIVKQTGNQLDASGNPILASYWKITQLQADVINHTMTATYSGYASATSFNASPTQTPLATMQINFPDQVNAPNAAWPFTPAALAANYPGNPMAFLMAMEAYAMSLPFFSGASQVS